jgi:hypothetical protein
MKLLYLGLACTALSGSSYENERPESLSISVDTSTPQDQMAIGSPLSERKIGKMERKNGMFKPNDRGVNEVSDFDANLTDPENDPTIARVFSHESVVDMDTAEEEKKENEDR